MADIDNEIIEQVKIMLGTLTDLEDKEYLKEKIMELEGELEKSTSPKAEEYIEELNNINDEIDEFIDLKMHGEIRNDVEDIEGELLKEELNYQYIEAEILLSKAMEEIEKAMESINSIYSDIDKT